MEEYTCPNCNKSFSEKDQNFPFCCERCKLIDLGAWADEQYAIPGENADDENHRES